jgi:hypothetical protein
MPGLPSSLDLDRSQTILVIPVNPAETIWDLGVSFEFYKKNHFAYLLPTFSKYYYIHAV